MLSDTWCKVDFTRVKLEICERASVDTIYAQHEYVGMKAELSFYI